MRVIGDAHYSNASISFADIPLDMGVIQCERALLKWGKQIRASSEELCHYKSKDWHFDFFLVVFGQRKNFRKPSHLRWKRKEGCV